MLLKDTMWTTPDSLIITRTHLAECVLGPSDVRMKPSHCVDTLTPTCAAPFVCLLQDLAQQQQLMASALMGGGMGHLAGNPLSPQAQRFAADQLQVSQGGLLIGPQHEEQQ